MSGYDCLNKNVLAVDGRWTASLPQRRQLAVYSRCVEPQPQTLGCTHIIECRYTAVPGSTPSPNEFLGTPLRQTRPQGHGGGRWKTEPPSSGGHPQPSDACEVLATRRCEGRGHGPCRGSGWHGLLVRAGFPRNRWRAHVDGQRYRSSRSRSAVDPGILTPRVCGVNEKHRTLRAK